MLGPAGKLPPSIEVTLGHLVKLIDGLPTVVGQLLREEMIDLLAHHRLRVLKDANSGATSWPAGRLAQQMIAANTSRHTFKMVPGLANQEIARTALQTNLPFMDSGGGREFWPTVEEGGVVHARSPMAIPMHFGAKRTKGGLVATNRFKALLKERAFSVDPGGLLYASLERGSKKLGTVKGQMAVFGGLMMQRKQRPILGWHRNWTTASNKKMAVLDKALELAQDEAGRVELVRRAENARAAEARAEIEALSTSMGRRRADQKQFIDAAKRAARRTAFTARGERA